MNEYVTAMRQGKTYFFELGAVLGDMGYEFWTAPKTYQGSPKRETARGFRKKI